MEPNHVILFREIEFVVARLMFGDEDAKTEVYRNLVGSALRQHNVHSMCEMYCYKSDPND